MSKKGCVLAAAQFRNHADQVSKAALIDLVYDLLKKEHGEETAWDSDISIDAFNEAFGPVAIVREDKMPKRKGR